MGWGLLPYALAIALLAILLSAGIEDARTREIANWKNAAIALLAPVWWVVLGYGWVDIAWQVGIGLAVFAIFSLVYLHQAITYQHILATLEPAARGEMHGVVPALLCDLQKIIH